MYNVILTTFNARYSHASLGLRYLRANMGDLTAATHIEEFILDTRPIDALEQLLQHQPIVIGLGVYIWNIEQSLALAALIKTVSPQTVVVLGGPEVSYEYLQQPIMQYADYLICGQADLAFPDLCREILDGKPPQNKIVTPLPFKLEQLQLPYQEYNEMDIATRNIYVEASRGCPFKCEFCLSSLDKTAWAFDQNRFLEQIQSLYERGARSFRFVDRTFNLKAAASARILQFFLEHMSDDLFVHFEVIPDHLPEQLKELIVQFPPGCLQFEVGVQTFNPEVQQLISRRQDNEKTRTNLRWLREHTHAHIHADLIAGLPGEDLESFARGFDDLVVLRPHEIQVGILKRLRGSPIIRHTEEFSLRFNPAPPYNILSTNLLSFSQLQDISRFARYWDLCANSGRFKHSLPLILGEHPFQRFMALSQWIYRQTQRMHKLSLQRLFYLLYQGAQLALHLTTDELLPALQKDFAISGVKGTLENVLTRFEQRQQNDAIVPEASPFQRQARHISTQEDD
ncbi:MAG: B12-binding domain-containing radical SAM protein [Gammaproteobacteria bacterium]|nr:B12-binding domain-containing radical SAM protein [Gammaproteobacteria bacterium]